MTQNLPITYPGYRPPHFLIAGERPPLTRELIQQYLEVADRAKVMIPGSGNWSIKTLKNRSIFRLTIQGDSTEFCHQTTCPCLFGDAGTWDPQSLRDMKSWIASNQPRMGFGVETDVALGGISSPKDAARVAYSQVDTVYVHYNGYANVCGVGFSIVIGDDDRFTIYIHKMVPDTIHRALSVRDSLLTHMFGPDHGL